MYEFSKQVVSQFLYGQDTPPEDMTSPDLIRSGDVKGHVEMTIPN